jgi:hypothetical protein
MVDNPFELLNKSQKLALNVAGEAFDTLLSVGRTAAQPDEAVRQLTTLISAVGELASATVQPLQDFIGRQRELADTMANLATMQAELAELVETLAHKHAAIVESLESLTAPVFGLVAKQEHAEPSSATRPRAKKK